MLRSMFGMGFSEIVVILVVALIFLGPEKLPGAAKSISKGIRDLRKQTREIQDTIENDEQIGGAIRDLRSALRGEEIRSPAKKPVPPPGVPIPGEKPSDSLAAGATPPAGPTPPGNVEDAGAPAAPLPAATEPAEAAATAEASAVAEAPAAPTVTLPPVAGEVAPAAETAAEDAGDDGGEQLAQLVRPAAGTVAKGR
jgi:sec-independent protein translocase protein TatB